MAIQYCGSSIITSTAETLVVLINCKGVAGCGLLFQFKGRSPGWYEV